jgi:thiamine pyrophosphate-dependent acetolactate synthase large subunit-like protein
MTTTAQLLTRLLTDSGVSLIFGVPGVHTVEFYRDFPRDRIRHITPRHEQGAAFMAYGYAFATGQPGVCMLITGPGVLNAATAIAEAYSDSLPMLVIAASNLRRELGVGRGALHEMRSQVKLEEQVSAFSHLLLDAANLEEIFARIFSLFETTRPRPACLEIPRDLFNMEAPAVTGEWRKGHRPCAPREALAEAAACLRRAARPVIIAGGGSWEAAEAVCMLSRRLAIPVVTTNAGKGTVPETDALSLGSSLPFRPVQELIRSADVVLAVGTELGETDLLYTCEAYKIEGKLIRIDIDPEQLTKNYRPSLSILSDARSALLGILEHLGDDCAPPAVLAERESDISALRASLLGQWSADAPKHKKILDILMECLQPDAIVCADSTQLAYTGNHYFRSKRPRTWLFPNGYGTLGSALPAAIGARLGAPTRQVVCVVGDGSFLYTVQELASAVENRVGFPVILWNNQGYGEIRDSMLSAGIAPLGVDLYTPDFVSIARGFGCHALRLTQLRDLAGMVEGAMLAERPTVIEIDANASFWTVGGEFT